MNTHPLLIEQTYDFSIDKVWSALTDNENLKKWYFQLGDFQPKVGFIFRFSGTDKGVMFWHRCEIIKVIPSKKLVHTWVYENYPGKSVVTWELFDEGNRTGLRLTHSGLETFPQDNPSFAVESFAKGWTHISGKNFKNFLES